MLCEEEEDDKLRFVMNSLKERFNVEIRDLQRRKKIAKSRMTKFGTTQPSSSSCSTSYYHSDRLKHFANTIVSDALNELPDAFYESLSPHVFSTLKAALKQNQHDIHLCTEYHIQLIVRYFFHYTSTPALTESHKDTIIQLSQIIYYLSTASKTAAVSVQLNNSISLHNISIYQAVNLSEFKQMINIFDQEFGQLEYFERAISSEVREIVSAGVSALCNCVESGWLSIQLVMESQLFIICKQHLLNNLNSGSDYYSTIYIIIQLCHEYLRFRYNKQRQTDTVILLMKLFSNLTPNHSRANLSMSQSTEMVSNTNSLQYSKNQNDTELVLIISEALNEYANEELFVWQVHLNPSFMSVVFYWLKQNSNKRSEKESWFELSRNLLDILNLILEKEFTAVSLYIDSSFIEVIMSYLTSSDGQILEKTYYILGNLIADSYQIAVEISLNPSLMNALRVHAERGQTSVAFDLSFFLRNLAIKIEHLPDESFFLTQIGDVFKIIQILLSNFTAESRIVMNLIRTINIFFDFSIFDQKLRKTIEIEIESTGTLAILQSIFSECDKNKSEDIYFFISKIIDFCQTNNSSCF